MNNNTNKNNKTSLLVTTALMTALVFICTVLLKIPVGPDCYIHLGDAVIILAVLKLPRPYACFAGSVGATLADLIGGFAFWAPWTFFVKLLMVLVLGIFVDKSKNILGFVVAGIVAVIGYFCSEYMLFGSWAPAATCIPFNIIQVTVGAVVAEIISKRTKPLQ